MDWENERYVRIYVRDTVDLALMHWVSRNALWELFRKMDRAGVIDLGEHDPARGLAALMRMPEEVMRGCLEDWLRDGVVELHTVGGAQYLVSPNYIEAQEAKQSDRARAKSSRELRRDRARLLVIVEHMDGERQSETPGDGQHVLDDPGPPDSVTERDAADVLPPPAHGPVTNRDETVTQRTKSSLRAVPYRADPCADARARTRPDPGGLRDRSDPETWSPDAKRIFEVMGEYRSLREIHSMKSAEQAKVNSFRSGATTEECIQYIRELGTQGDTALSCGTPWTYSYLIDRFARYTSKNPAAPGGPRASRHSVRPRGGDSDERRQQSRKAWSESEEHQALADECDKVGI